MDLAALQEQPAGYKISPLAAPAVATALRSGGRGCQTEGCLWAAGTDRRAGRGAASIGPEGATSQGPPGRREGRNEERPAAASRPPARPEGPTAARRPGRDRRPQRAARHRAKTRGPPTARRRSRKRQWPPAAGRRAAARRCGARRSKAERAKRAKPPREQQRPTAAADRGRERGLVAPERPRGHGAVASELPGPSADGFASWPPLRRPSERAKRAKRRSSLCSPGVHIRPLSVVRFVEKRPLLLIRGPRSFFWACFVRCPGRLVCLLKLATDVDNKSNLPI